MILTRLGLDFAQTAPAGSEAKKKEQRLRRFIPYVAHYDAETLLTEDDQLIQIIKLEGLAFQTRDEEDLRRQKRFRNRLVRCPPYRLAEGVSLSARSARARRCQPQIQETC